MQKTKRQTEHVFTLGQVFINGLSQLHKFDGDNATIIAQVGADLSMILEMFIASQPDIERQSIIREKFLLCLNAQKGKLLPPLDKW